MEKDYKYLISLVNEWLEFKHNNAEAEEIGEYISALSNSAALVGKANTYMLGNR